MNGIYTNLAFNSLRKNRNFYLPYIASSAVMIALFYILRQLAIDPIIRTIHGGKTLVTILGIGMPVIGLLSALFIIYMSSFIMKRRKKELGLYSVLGMEKRHIIRVVFIENVIVSLSSLASGMVVGILFEKLAQLFLLKLLNQEADLGFDIYWDVVSSTLMLFGCIYIFILLNSIREILFKSTLEYIKEEQVGERKPKARWFLFIVGLVILGIAYYMACTVTSGAEALTRFMGAVILVIIATYILFIVGSIAVLEIMKKNKNYYYKTNNFISVSGMTYRMKRNGAGLASICILSTMVLVMLSSVTTVFFYNGKAFDDRFMYDFGICADDYKHIYEDSPETIDYPRQEIIDQIYLVADRADVEVENLVYYETFDYYGGITGNRMECLPDFNSVYYEYWFVTNSDYNRINNTNLELSDNQIGWKFMANKYEFAPGEIVIDGVGTFEGIKLDEKPNIMPGEYTSTSMDILFIVLPDSITITDLSDMVQAEADRIEPDAFYFPSNDETYYAFNIKGGDDENQAFFDKYNEIILEPISDDELSEFNTNFGTYDGVYRTIFSSMLFKQIFYNMYGGLFFLGILLSVACIVIAVLIMYFKQLLEGYEDAKRFTIMKKVGLTTEEIRKSIYSQIVMVFITPLIAAGIHTAFAYKLIKSLIILFGISSIDGYFVILLISMLVFMAFYGIVFAITGQKYLKIVNAAENAV